MTERRPGLVGNAARASVAGFSTLLLAVLLVIAGRLLGDAEYGKFTFALALAMIFETVIDFGLKEITTREVARNRSAARELVAQTFGLKLVLAAVASIGLVVAANLSRPEPDVRLACYLLGAASILRSYLLTLRYTLQGIERFGLDGIVVGVDRLLLLVLGVGALAGGFGLFGLAIAFVGARVISLLVACVLAAGQIGTFHPAFDRSRWLALQHRALPFGAFVVVLYLYSYADTVMLGVLRDDTETGLYNAAYRIYEGLASVGQVLQTVLIPRLSHHYATSRVAHGRLARGGLVVGGALALPAATLGVALAAPIVTLLFGATFGAASGVLQLLAVGLVAVFPLCALHAVALSVGAAGWLLRTAVVGCTLNIGLNLVLIPRFGMHGAAAATVAGETLSLIVLAWGLRRYLRPVGAGALATTVDSSSVRISPESDRRGARR